MVVEDGARPESDLLRVCLPLAAAAVAVVAYLVDPGDWWHSLLLVVPAVAIAAWSRWFVSLLMVTPAVLVPVVLSQWSGALEPGMFLVSILALIITGWYPLTLRSGVLVLSALLCPVAVVLINNDISWGNWVVGIAFPVLMGWVTRRERLLTATLEKARQELAGQAVLEERRRIARDVHDLVGHGLAAMMLQVTSARHVLKRDPRAADEALETLEEAGRRSLQELRWTVAMLREGDSAVAPPPPTLSQVEALVEVARSAGLRVDYTVIGEPEGVDRAVGLTLYRIVQESLANASRHAPHATTCVTTTVGPEAVTVEVATFGSLATVGQDRDRRRYGVRGMQERAEVIGGELAAGPVPGGWLVRCAVPTGQPPDLPVLTEAALP